MKIEEQKSSLVDEIHWHLMDALVAVFDNVQQAHETVGLLDAQDFPMDQISILHLPKGEKTDFLGLSYDNEKRRTKVWAEDGALWGALIGLAVGASGFLFIPGVGVLLALGPVIDTIAGAAIGAGIMAGAAKLTQLSTALEEIGIPADRTEQFQKALLDGKTLLILHIAREEKRDWLEAIDWSRAESIEMFRRPRHGD